MSRIQKVALLAIVTGVLVLPTALAHDVPSDVPRLNGIRIDGSAEDWGDRGFLVAILTDPEGRIHPANDFDVRFRLGWDRTGLLVLAEVQDDLATEARDVARLRSGDAIEVLVAQSLGSCNRYGLVIAAGADPSFGEPRGFLHDYRPEFLRTGGIEGMWAATAGDNGYVVEALLPWTNLDVDPRSGLELAIQLTATDRDGETDPSGVIRPAWFPSDRSHRDARSMRPIRLARSAGPPVLLSAVREIDEAGSVVTVRGARETLGRRIVLRMPDGRSEVRRMTLLDGRAGARFDLWQTSAEDTWPAIVVESEDGIVAAFPALPTLETVLERWVEAAGGREAIERISTRTYVGEYAVELAYREPPRETGTLEIRFDVPDRWEKVVDDNRGTHRDVCDRGTGWREGPEGRERDDGLCGSLTAFLLDPHAPLRLREYYPELILEGTRALEGGDAYRVEARAPGKRSRALYFDVETGLLVQVGGNHALHDYRPVNGVLVPHRIVTSRKGGWAAFEFHVVTDDGPVRQARFVTAGPWRSGPR